MYVLNSKLTNHKPQTLIQNLPIPNQIGEPDVTPNIIALATFSAFHFLFIALSAVPAFVFALVWTAGAFPSLLLASLELPLHFKPHPAP